MNIFEKIFGIGLEDCICGGEPVYVDTKVPGSKHVQIVCPRCYMTVFGASKREAIRKWNSLMIHTLDNK